MKAFQPDDKNSKSSVVSSKSPLMIPHDSVFSSSELETVEEDGVDEDGVVEVVVLVSVDVVVDEGVEDSGNDDVSPQATRNKAASAVTDSNRFLFIFFSFSYE